MFESIFHNSTIPVLEQVVEFTHARHEVLAGNIANLDTPGYRVRDLSTDDFQSRLKEAIEARDRQPPASLGSVQAMPHDSLANVKETMRTLLHHDLSDVGLEQQVTEVAKNQGQFNTALAVMRSQFSLLQAAISERA